MVSFFRELSARFFVFVTISSNGRHELNGKKLEGPGSDAALEWGKFSGNCRFGESMEIVSGMLIEIGGKSFCEWKPCQRD